jgi:hypothetical protein
VHGTVLSLVHHCLINFASGIYKYACKKRIETGKRKFSITMRIHCDGLWNSKAITRCMSIGCYTITNDASMIIKDNFVLACE